MPKWSELDFGPLTRDEINKHVDSPSWQRFRQGLIGSSNNEKFRKLNQWLKEHNNSRASQVQITNYVSSLKRAGLI